MRTFEELKEKWYEASTTSFTDVVDDALKFAYNLALEDAAKNAEVNRNGNGLDAIYFVDEESILKLKI